MPHFKTAPFGARLEATTDALCVALPPFGFAAEPVRITDSGFRRQWLRALPWRMDIVERNGREGRLREQTVAYLKSVGYAVMIGFLSIFVSAGCAGSDVREAHDKHRRAAEMDGAMARRWVPAWLPASARDIREIHDLDTNAALLRFVYDPADEDELTKVCRPSDGPRHPLPRETYMTRRADWWPHELLAGERAIGFRHFRCIERRVFADGRTVERDAGLALRERESIAYFWR